ncbi:MAG: hypothetical protein ABIP49_04325 [Lysobacterales bacterium]
MPFTLHAMTRMRGCVLLLMGATAIAAGSLATAASPADDADATRVTATLAPLDARIDVVGSASAPIKAMLRDVATQRRFQHEWLFNNKLSRHRVTAPAAGPDLLRVVLASHGADTLTVVAPTTREYTEVDAAGALAEISGKPRDEDRYTVESIGVENSQEHQLLAGLPTRKSTVIVSLVSSDGLIGLRLERRIVATIWHTDRLSARAGLELTALVAGPDARAALRDTLAREDIGFPLLIQTRVHDWSGDGVHADPGSFEWRVSSIAAAGRADITLYERPAGLHRVEHLTALIAPRPDAGQLGRASTAPALPLDATPPTADTMPPIH